MGLYWGYRIPQNSLWATEVLTGRGEMPILFCRMYHIDAIFNAVRDFFSFSALENFSANNVI